MSNSIIDYLDELASSAEPRGGYQACLLVDGETAVRSSGGVDGLGRPMGDASTVGMYCSTKTLTVLLVAILVSSGELSFDDCVGDLLPAVEGQTASTTILDLLSHRSGIARPSMYEATTLRPEERLAVALSSTSVLPLGGDQSRYTEAAEWIVLSACVEAASGRPFRELVDSEIVQHHGALDFDLDGPSDGRRRIARAANPPFRPLLIEETDQLSFTDNPGYGGFCTTRALANVLEEFRVALSGVSDDALRISPSAAKVVLSGLAPRFDLTFRRPCSFSAGFLAHLSGHGFGSALSDYAVAQVGLAGMTTAVMDPKLRISAAVHLNVLSSSIGDMLDLRREIWSRVTRSI